MSASKFKISFSLRAFIAYFVIVGSLSWYLVDNALERLNDGMRQSAESVMVDFSHVLAASIEAQMVDQKGFGLAANTSHMQRLFNNIKQRSIEAKIYKVTKTLVDTDIYVTDSQGIVLFDSLDENQGADFSQWRDVRLTLSGEYGARTSFRDPNKTTVEDEKIMVVAAPIKWKQDIIGVVSVVKPINSLEEHLNTESNQLKRYALSLLLIAIIGSYLLSQWFTHSLKRISDYATSMASGKKISEPHFLDPRLENLVSSITRLRTQLDGKEYVENYIHSLTHELKTPITSIRGAAELIMEGMPAHEQQHFIANIHASNNRMAQLVDRMLSLAKLESQTELVEAEEFELSETVHRLLEERQSQLSDKQISINTIGDTPFKVTGDRVLIRQAIANLLDNAIDFSHHGSDIQIQWQQRADHQYRVSIKNHGSPIPDYALSRVFERFFSLPRKSSDQKTTTKSTGLGLSFVQEIMKLHQGRVQVENFTESGQPVGVVATIKWKNITSI